MEIKDLINEYRQRKPSLDDPKSEYGELVKKFSDRLNADRLKDGFKPFSIPFIRMKMSDAGLKSNSDLYWFLKYCEEAKSFGKCWWWSLTANKK